MDFNRALTSFRPHLDASINIIQLALDSTSAHPVRVLFSSSIAVVGRYPRLTDSPGATSILIPIAEAPLENPEAIDHFGYAEAKWVCEKMFERAAAQFADRLVANTVRIGQTTSPKASGAWNTLEHFPMIVKSCKSIGRLPAVEGVRLHLFCDVLIEY